MGDNVNHPAHYQGRFECIDEMIALFGVEDVVTWCKLNVYKYRFRAGAKNGAEDIKKAENYVAIIAALKGLEIVDQEALALQSEPPKPPKPLDPPSCDNCEYGPNDNLGPCRYCYFLSKYERREDE